MLCKGEWELSGGVLANLIMPCCKFGGTCSFFADLSQMFTVGRCYLLLRDYKAIAEHKLADKKP